MSSRERFEAWWRGYNAGLTETEETKEACDIAWQARDPEIARLVEALREARDLLNDGMWASADRREDVRDVAENTDSLLREYDGEKQDV